MLHRERLLRMSAVHASSPPDRDARRQAERLARDHYESLVRLGLRLTGNEAEARDLVQDTFERALKRYGSFKPGTNERAWLHSILYNAFIDQRRARASKQFVSDDAIEEKPADSAPEPPPWSTVSDAQLAAAIDSLGSDFREVYRMHAIEQRSYKEIAEAVSILPQTVATRLVRARQMLRAHLLEALGREGASR